MPVNEKDLKFGNRVRLTITAEGQPYERNATVISMDGSVHYYLDDRIDTGGVSSYPSYGRRREVEKLGLDSDKPHIWHNSLDTVVEEVLPIDPKTLKRGDKAEITITVRDGTSFTTTATAMGTQYSNHELFYLDKDFSDKGFKSFQLKGLQACYPDAYDTTGKAITELGLDKEGSRLWGIDKDTVINRVIERKPEPKPIDPKTAKCGDKIKFLYNGEGCEGIMLHPDFTGRPWIAETKRRTSSINLASWSDAEASKWALSAGIDTSKYDYASFDPSSVKIISVEPKPEEKPIDQDTLEVGDDVEIELVKEGKTIRRTATVVSTAKTERATFKNDSEAGLILHEVIIDNESPSFLPFIHWQENARSLKLPCEVPKNGWRAYKSGRNATKIVKKLGKRTIDSDAQADMTEGRRIEFSAHQTTAGCGNLIKGTILKVSGNRTMVILDDADWEIEWCLTGQEFQEAKHIAARYGLEATQSRCAWLSKVSKCRALDKLTPIQPPTLDEVIDQLGAKLQEARPVGLGSEKIPLDREVVKQVLAYAVEQRKKEKAALVLEQEPTPGSVEPSAFREVVFPQTDLQFSRQGAEDDKELAQRIKETIEPEVKEDNNQALGAFLIAGATILGSFLGALGAPEKPAVRVAEPPPHDLAEEPVEEAVEPAASLAH